MARKTKYSNAERGAELTELLDSLEKLLERTKVLYEQYFMGIQKIAPSQLHRDIERRMRELTQEQIRNTALRFRLTTLSQKFGSYNTYWKRTMRAIEQGRYQRDIARVRRKAQRRGEDVPDELLANMPKRMRDRIRRDRDQLAERRQREQASHDEAQIHDALPGDADDWELDAVLDGLESGAQRQPGNVHQIDDDFDNMFDEQFDELFDALTREAEKAVSSSSSGPSAGSAGSPARAPARPAAPPTARPAAPPTAAPKLADGSTASPQKRARERAEQQAEAEIRAQRSRRAATATRGIEAPNTAASRKGPPPPPGMTEDETRSLYDQYRKARRLVGASEGISYDRLKSRLSEQAPRIMKQYDTQALEYNVVVKDDKVVVKASPKRK